MKTPLFALALIPFMLQSSLAPAQTSGAYVDPEFLPHRGPTCFKVQDPKHSCLLVETTVVDYKHPRFNVVDLNGAWAGPSNETPYIYIYGGAGNPIFVEMSQLNRPDGFGYFVDEHTIAVVFPDDQSYTGTLVDEHTIVWSNNTTWRKR